MSNRSKPTRFPRATIGRPEQLAALASPLRQELLDVLESAGPSTIAELAARLGRAPDALYFHVRRLTEVGLVVESERRQIGRHAFSVYDVARRPVRIDRTRAKPRDLEPVVASVLRLALRDYRNALTHPTTRVKGPRRNHWGGRVRGWLGPRDIALANQLLERLNELFREARPGRGKTPVALAWVLAPTPPRTARKKP